MLARSDATLTFVICGLKQMCYFMKCEKIRALLCICEKIREYHEISLKYQENNPMRAVFAKNDMRFRCERLRFSFRDQIVLCNFTFLLKELLAHTFDQLCLDVDLIRHMPGSNHTLKMKAYLPIKIKGCELFLYEI